MKKGKYLFSLLNGKKDEIRYFDIDYSEIKEKVLGFCSVLYVVCDSYYKAPYATIYRFTSDVLKSDDKLRSILFGREKSIGEIHLTQTQINFLSEHYTYSASGEKLFFDMIPKTDLEKELNKGIGIEYYMCEKYGFTHGTKKQDISQCIDIIEPTRKRAQVKCSLTLEKSKGKGSRTNTNHKR